MDIICAEHLKKFFQEGSRQIRALDGIDLTVEKGKITAVIGASGSGKTTLFNLIGGLYRPTGGRILVDGDDLAELTEDQLTVYRRRKVGFVFQEHRLIPELTIRENILFPLSLDDSRVDEIFFGEITAVLGLSGKLDCYPHMLSGGGRQCAAIARALITRPSILLADEPTGSLDVRTGQSIAMLLKRLNKSYHQTLLMITHNRELAQLADRVIQLRDGRIVY